MPLDTGSDPRTRIVHAACPHDCPDTCAMLVTVENGRATSIRGDPAHPPTQGVLCTKVARYLERTYSPDRVLHPMRRVGRKGEGRFERISWDEALDEIAGRLGEIRREYGGQAVWPFHGTGSLGYIQGLEGFAGRRFFNMVGASVHEPTIRPIAGAV